MTPQGALDAELKAYSRLQSAQIELDAVEAAMTEAVETNNEEAISRYSARAAELRSISEIITVSTNNIRAKRMDVILQDNAFQAKALRLKSALVIREKVRKAAGRAVRKTPAGIVADSRTRI